MVYIQRKIEKEVVTSIKYNPVTAVIGPRQCGKSTLVKKLLQKYKNSIYLDLERSSDLQKLDNAEWFFLSQKGKLICIDEIQRKPDLFPIIRSLVDEWGNNGKFLILGSSSGELLKQSSESLAGRISYKRLTPFLFDEIKLNYSIEKYINSGGFPRSLLAKHGSVSFDWRSDFISTFLERDLRQWIGSAPVTMRRLWQMLAHHNGQTVNYSSIGKSLGMSNVTISTYIDLLEGTFMVEVLPPYISNMGKRLVKASKVYVADSGITLALLGLKNFEELSGHPALGSVWEQIVLSNLKGYFPKAEFYYYRTSAGAEIDIVVKINKQIFAIECKASLSPSLTKGTFFAIEDIQPNYTFIVAPVQSSWSVKKSIDIVSVSELLKQIQKKIK